MSSETLPLYDAWLEAIRVRDEFALLRPTPEWSSSEFFQYEELNQAAGRAYRAWWSARGNEDWVS